MDDEAADDVVPRGLVLRVLGATIAFGLFLCATAAILLHRFESAARPSGRFDERELGAPRTVAAVRADPYELPVTEERADRDRALLDRYGWIDRAQGIVRVPVDKAIDLLLDAEEHR